MLSIMCALMLFAGSQAQVTYMGSGPNDLSMKNFDSSRMLGRWYEIERYGNSYEENQKCSSVNFISGENNEIKVEKAATVIGSGAQIKWEGTEIPLGDPSIPHYHLIFPQYSAVPTTYVTIVDTDYDRYAIILLCQIMGDVSQVYTWIVSRTKTLDEDIIERAHKILSNHHVPSTPLRRVDQVNCPP